MNSTSAPNTDNTDTPPTGPRPQEVNQVTASLTDEFINEPDVFSPFECNDVFTLLNDDNVATSLCCPVAQLSTLTYIDVMVRSSEEGPCITTRCLADTGAQICVIKSELIDGFDVEVKGKIKLQPFLGNGIEADWVKLQISPFTEERNNAYITIIYKNCNHFI